MARRILITVGHADSDDTWTEKYEEGTTRFFPARFPEAQLESLARGVIEFFNSTLREGERARRFVAVATEETKDAFEHEFVKTNLVTICGHGGRTYDTVKCARCDVRGRRYGIQHIVRDREFRAKKYATCKG